MSYATTNLGYSRPTSLTVIAVGALIATFTIRFCELLSDRIGRRSVFLAGSVGLIAFSAPYFLLLSQRFAVCILIASNLAIGLIWPLVTATLRSLPAEMFQSRVRYSLSASNRRCAGWRYGAARWRAAACPRSWAMALDCVLHREHLVDFVYRCFAKRDATSRCTNRGVVA